MENQSRRMLTCCKAAVSSELGQAILRQSEFDIVRLLVNDPDCLNDICSDLDGENMLHLASGWPKGLALLLKRDTHALLCRRTLKGRLPLHYAVMHNSLESVAMLLTAGSPITWACFSYLPSTHNHMESHLFKAIVERRKGLKALALNHLPADLCAVFDLFSSNLPDEKAPAVCSALRDRGIVLPSELMVPDEMGFEGCGNAYHFRRANQFDELWEHGFRDIDSDNTHGFTPLIGDQHPSSISSTNIRLDEVNWLIRKGANFRKPFRPTPYQNTALTSAHILAFKFASHLFDRYFISEDANMIGLCAERAIYISKKYARLPKNMEIGTAQELKDILKLPEYSNIAVELLSLSTTDRCRCACSNAGCLPLSVFMRSVGCESDRDRYESERAGRGRILTAQISDAANKRRVTIQWMHDLFQAQGQSRRLSATEVIRFETFERLGLRHTCHHQPRYCFDGSLDSGGWDFSPEDLEDIEEIFDEDKYVHGRLERLCVEFEEKYTELGEILPLFLDGYWETRMGEEMLELEGWKEEEAVKAVAAGVKLESSPSTVKL